MQFRSTGVAAFAAVVIVVAGCGSDDSELAQRQEEVAEIGAQVMPFDLDATTHIFTDTDTGGIQDVVADDADDDANIALIREHLSDEAAKFQAGDFSDPEEIHGAGMPGLATLQSRYAEVSVDLSTTDTGATITYVASDPVLVTAIHDWFQAQTTDHGAHAEHGG
jgi:hypothetical protein